MAIAVTCFQGYVPIYETYKIGDTGAHQHHRLDQVYQEISFLLGFFMVKHKKSLKTVWKYQITIQYKKIIKKLDNVK